MKTLLKNGKIWTGNNNFTDSAGFDSETGKIIFTGNYSKNILSDYGFDEITDLKGKLVIPAFAEGHCHFIQGSLINSQLDLRNAGTINEFEEKIREYKKINKGTWIYGGYFAESNFRERIPLSKKFLDVICPDIPLIISRFDLHSAFANSKAFEISGLLSKVAEFTEEEIIRENNFYTGEIKERARDFILAKIPPAALSERIQIVIDQISKLHSLGITSISDITLPEDLEIYKELINRNLLSLRVDSRLPFAEFGNLERHKEEFSEYSSKIKFNSLKAFYDGSLSSRTAYMFSNYKNSNRNGIRTEYAGSGEFEKTAFEIDRAGYQISVHAIGDRAVSDLLDLNEKLIEVNGIKDRRFRIEHAQHIHEKDIRRFKDLKVVASVQPSHLFSDAKTSAEILNDYKTVHNYNKLFEAGASVCFGTDFPVVSENPFETIYFAVTRKAEGFKDGFVNENRISLINCLEAYTSGNAYATFSEDSSGAIQKNKTADIAVLEDDLFSMNPDEIKNAKVSMTYFEGKRVY